MGAKTKIDWTEHTFNPWWICTEVSPGCDNCYAREWAARFGYGWGKGVPRRVFGEKHWAEPLAWEAKAMKAGKPALVFCASMADIMDDEAPEGQRDRLWKLIDQTPHLIWQLLTKRPQRYQRYLPSAFAHENVWLGTTTEDQPNYDLRWPFLYAAARRRNLKTFISYEPALGPLEMTPMIGPLYAAIYPDWAIFGGESGGGRRPMDVKWVEDLMAQCQKTGTKLFVKQFSAITPEAGKLLIPSWLRIHQFPKGGK